MPDPISRTSRRADTPAGDIPGDPTDPRHSSQSASRAISTAGWAALLARWTEFARASVAFPKTAEGRAWSSSVAPAITLQAISFALADLESIEADERPLALDRASILIESASAEIHSAWAPESAHEELLELIEDARQALRDARRDHAA